MLFCLFITTVYLGVVGRPVRGNGMSGIDVHDTYSGRVAQPLEAEYSAQSRASPLDF